MVDVADTARGEELARRLSGSGPGLAAYVRADLTKPVELYAALRRPLELFGDVATIVVGNAGIVVKDDDPRVAAMFELNATAVVQGTQWAAELIKGAGRTGVVVNTASMAGLTPVVLTPAYAATKWAVVGYTLSLKPMLKSHGVRVNCVCPALVHTPQVGEFFKHEFHKEPQGSVVRGLADKALSARHVAQVFMRVIADDSLVASAVLVTPEKVLVHDPGFSRTLAQPTNAKVPDYMSRV